MDMRSNTIANALNVNKVKENLFEYQGKGNVRDVRGIGGGFQDLVGTPNQNAGKIYSQVNELLQDSIGIYVKKTDADNQANELRQFINAGKELSTAYQQFQVEKENLPTAEEKQVRIDKFREDIYNWSEQLTDKNKNSILSTTNNYLTFEAREQGGLVRKENVNNISKSLSDTASTLLSMNDDEMFSTIDTFKETANKVGISDNEFNEIAFKQLNTNLLLGLNKKNISREALDIIEGKANVLSEKLYGVKETQAYKTSMTAIENLRNGLNERDLAVIRRSTQVGDYNTFKLYNEDLYDKGVITEIEYKQNEMYYQQTRKVEKETTASSVEGVANFTKETLGFDINEVPYSVLKDVPNLSTKQKSYIKNMRNLEVTQLLSSDNVNMDKAYKIMQRDTDIFASGFKTYATQTNTALKTIIGSGALKDSSSKEYGEGIQRIGAELNKIKMFIDNPNFSIHLTKDSKKEIDFIRATKDILEDSLIPDKQKALMNMYNEVKLDDVQTKSIKDLTEEFKKSIPKDTYNEYLPQITESIVQYTKAGMGNDAIKKALDERYKDIDYSDSNFTMTGEVARRFLGSNNERGAKAIDDFFFGTDLQNAVESAITEDYEATINSAKAQGIEVDEKVINERLLKDLTEEREALAKFRLSLGRMFTGKEDTKPRIYFDKDVGSAIITNGKDRIAVPKIYKGGVDITNKVIEDSIAEYLKGTPYDKQERRELQLLEMEL